MSDVAGDAGLVESWFGDGFSLLHPSLQALHRRESRLEGPVDIRCGTGLAGLVGARLAQRLGIPRPAPNQRLTVEIHADAQGLHWNRRFSDGHTFPSVFTPVGCYPHGHWLERSGLLSLALGVEVIDGAWHWRPRRAWLGRLPVPLALLPRTHAHKAVVDGRYRFEVRVTWPVLGDLLSYSGSLEATAADNSPAGAA